MRSNVGIEMRLCTRCITPWRSVRTTSALAAVMTLFAATGGAATPAGIANDIVIPQHGMSDDQIALEDTLRSQAPDAFMSTLPQSERTALVSFYAKRQFRPTWSGGSLEKERATEAL